MPSATEEQYHLNATYQNSGTTAEHCLSDPVRETCQERFEGTAEQTRTDDVFGCETHASAYGESVVEEVVVR